MTKHILQQIIDDSEGFTSRSYSGRGMYGKTCLGVELNRDNTLGGFLAALVWGAEDNSRHLMDDLAEGLRSAQTDSMGLGQILYFPNVPYTDEDDEDSGEDSDEDEE